MKQRIGFIICLLMVIASAFLLFSCGDERGDERYDGDSLFRDFVYEAIYSDGVVTEYKFVATTDRVKDKNIVLPESYKGKPVTAIENGAFSGNSNLISIKIPNSVTNIGERAFANCSNLASVELPNSVTSIRERTFENCGSLTSVNG